jgi:hypothetical protein
MMWIILLFDAEEPIEVLSPEGSFEVGLVEIRFILTRECDFAHPRMTDYLQYRSLLRE